MDIASKILNNMDTNLSPLEKARYIYLNLCEILTFSTTYQNTDNKTRGELYIKNVDATSLDSTEVNCRIWSQLYCSILTQVGINNRFIDQGHAYVEFEIDNQKWVADPTYGVYNDLSRVKNGDETVGFGLSLFQKTDKYYNIPVINEETKEQLKQIDEKLNYNLDKQISLLEFKERLKKICEGDIDILEFSHGGDIGENNLLFLKLEYLFSQIGKLGIGYYEQKDFVRNLETLILTEEEREQVGAVELKKTNFDKTVDIVQCIYAKSNGENNYYILHPNMEIQKCSDIQITKLSIMGYGIEEKSIPGIIFPTKFEKGKVSSTIRYKLYNALSKRHLMEEDSLINKIEEAQKAK